MTLSNRNALQHESSPYLLQHANNPVYWFAWNDEALKLAQAENKPILLSIGYSACHWCHVMAHESFEDEATAMIMNQYFVNIKVDREERPDLDRVYQLAHQLLTQRSGGWPLTVFLTPDDRIPFFAGTYFPKQARYNLPSFQQLLHKVAQFYSEHLDELRKQNESLLEAIRSLRPAEPLDPALELSAAPLDIGRRQLQENMDWEHGGFGKAPKFPHATSLSMLIQHWWGTRTHAPTADVKALEMAQFTLAKMANGGINDQVGGGFCRYSVDDYWMIPHFEKMLYDNGSLLHVYVEAWLATRNPLFQQVAESIGQWVIRDMQSTSGGYFSSIDADSEGKEGAFYVWSKDEVRAVLPETDYPLYARRFGLNFPANFEDKWYPHVFTDWESLANEFQLDRTELQSRVGHCNQLLHKQREKRIHPNRDEKILCAWNALMIKAMAFAGQFLQAPEFIASAEKALTFIHEHHWHKGRLLATSKNGKAQLMAYLDDYIFLADALLSLLQVRWRDQDLGFLITVVETVLDRFEDKESGGFYFTAHDHEPLIDRPKPFGDESLASGNGVAVSVLIKMGYLLSDEKYLVAAERCLKAAWPSINQLPYAHNTLLQGLRLYLDPPEIIVLRGEQDAISRWRHRCLQAYSPSRLVFAIPNDSQNLPAALHSKHVSDTTVAYRCLGSHCSAPIKDIEALSRLLQRKRS